MLDMRLLRNVLLQRDNDEATSLARRRRELCVVYIAINVLELGYIKRSSCAARRIWWLAVLVARPSRTALKTKRARSAGDLLDDQAPLGSLCCRCWLCADSSPLLTSLSRR